MIGGRSLGRSGWACLDRKDPPASLFIDSFLKDRSFIGLVRSPPHIGVRLCRVEVRRIRPLVCRDRARTDRSTSLSLSLSLSLSFSLPCCVVTKWFSPTLANDKNRASTTGRPVYFAKSQLSFGIFHGGRVTASTRFGFSSSKKLVTAALISNVNLFRLFIWQVDC